MENEVIENVMEPVVKETSKIDLKGAGVIIGVASAVITAIVFGVKKIRAHKAAKAENAVVKPVEVTEAEA